MKKSQMLLVGLALGVVLLTAGVFAYQGDPETTGPGYSLDRHTAMQSAFNGTGYQAWLEQMSQTRSRLLGVINEDNFPDFVSMRDARISGDIETAQQIRSSLGLGQWQGSNNGNYGSGNGQAKNGNYGDCPYAN